MSNRYWAAIIVFVVAVGLLLWGFSLHPENVSARGGQVAPYFAKGLGVIGLIGSMVLFLVAARQGEGKNKL